MRWLTWLIFTVPLICIISAWVFYFCLYEEKVVVKQTPSVEETARSFCEALYNKNYEVLATYATEQVVASVIPPGESKKEANIRIRNISVFVSKQREGITKSIAVVERTIQVKGKSIDTTHYLELSMHKEKVWLVDEVRVIADIPN
ncbi:hypothetical protein MUG87_01505 [Ectobacillus sp. JY-23]|uniref:hypothetical protein n=1 Tax=Ectobacillus sp. JY-23 TaxID=2933872 RepID=UPI001FF29A41|nr:hypothetical protein [Ectobacillus sp. JY-23]UOY92849.1 hypothetical protein MUG87_01505 [Ectobacillus sp. JY-23]